MIQFSKEGFVVPLNYHQQVAKQEVIHRIKRSVARPFLTFALIGHLKSRHHQRELEKIRQFFDCALSRIVLFGKTFPKDSFSQLLNTRVTQSSLATQEPNTRPCDHEVPALLNTVTQLGTNGVVSLHQKFTYNFFQSDYGQLWFWIFTVKMVEYPAIVLVFLPLTNRTTNSNSLLNIETTL